MAGAVIVESRRLPTAAGGLGIEAAAGVVEAGWRGGREAGVLAKRLVAGLGQGARGGIENTDQGPLNIGDQRLARGRRNVHLVQHIVGSETETVPAQQRPAATRAVILQYLAVVGIRDIDRCRAADGLRLAPPPRVIGICRDGGRGACARTGADNARQAALIVVAVGKGPIAACWLAERCCPRSYAPSVYER